MSIGNTASETKKPLRHPRNDFFDTLQRELDLPEINHVLWTTVQKIREGVYQDESQSLVDLAEKSMGFLSRPHYEETELFKDLLTCYQNEQGANDTLQQHCYDIYGMRLAMRIDAEGSWRTELDQLFNDLAIEPRRLNYDVGSFQEK